MSKKFFRVCLAIMLAWFVTPNMITKAASAPIISYGSFIQPYVTYIWTIEDWKEELSALKEAGNQLLILQWTADSKSKLTIYPTSIPGLTQESNYKGDPVENLLAAADALEMKVWLGTNVNDDWYIHHALDQPWLDELFDYGGQMVNELWNNYHQHPSLTGFYFPNEMENCSYQDDESIANLTAKFASLADLVHSLTGTTLSLAPAIWNERNCGQPYETNSAAWIKTWDGILGGANIDYLIPQDGLGGLYHSVEEVINWFRLTKEVVDRYPATRLWADVETFHTNNNDPWISEPMVTKDIVDHMTKLQPYVDKIVSFSYDHYQAPKLRNSRLFHEAFMKYYSTGKLETTGPKIPFAIKSPKQGIDKITLSWSGAPDTFYYVIYRDGIAVGKTYEGYFQDNGLKPGKSYAYQIEAYGAAGYPSAKSIKMKAATLASSVNIAKNKPYSSTIPALSAYPDTGRKEMTNGVLGGDYSDKQWQGRSSEAAPLVFSYTVDLGSRKWIEGVSIRFYQNLNSAIKLPRSVEFQVSDDNVNFTSLGAAPYRPLNFGPIPSDLAPVMFGLIPKKSVKSRYVKITVTTTNYAWTFCDELLVEQYPLRIK